MKEKKMTEREAPKSFNKFQQQVIVLGGNEVKEGKGGLMRWG